MPNWCSNHLTLTHKDPAQIDRAVAAFAKDKLLHEFCPCPEDLRDFKPEKPGFLEQDQRDANRAKYGYESWYDWSIAHWGTKWDVGGEEIDHEPGSTTVKLYFDSAWAPPLIAMQAFEAAGFDVLLYFYEPGMAFCGKYTTEDGEDYYDYSDLDADALEQELPEDIDEEFGVIEYLRELEESLRDDNIETDPGIR